MSKETFEDWFSKKWYSHSDHAEGVGIGETYSCYDNCKVTWNHQQEKIDQKDERIKELEERLKEANKTIEIKKEVFAAMEDVATSWMNKYDELKNKYEPEIFIESKQ